MRISRTIITAAALGAAVGLAGAPAQAEEHGHHDMCDEHAAPGPLLSVADVTGDGVVDGDDVAAVATRIGGDYHYLYDRDVDGDIDDRDVVLTAADRGADVPLVDSQVAQLALATMRYLDVENAYADGYVPGTQYFPGHGYHFINEGLRAEPFDLTRPAGLNYDADGNLMAVFYFIDAGVHGMTAPEGFAGHEDMWHHHSQVCAFNLGAQDAAGDYDWSMPFFIEDVGSIFGYWFPGVCQSVVAPYLQANGYLQTPQNVDEVRDYQFDMFHMMHVWVTKPNPCGRFAGTHPDA